MLCVVLLAIALGLGFTYSNTSRAEPGSTVRAVDLKAQPASDAKTVASLPSGSTVDIVARQGAWVHLKAGTTLGWAKMFDVRLAPVTGTAKSTGSNDALNLAMCNRGSSVTTGVRGLDADMLEKAVPNPQQFQKLVSYMRNREEATAFGRAGNLKARDVAVLNPADAATPAPAPAKGGAK